MASGTLIPPDEGHVTDIDVSAEMKSSFLTYAYSVIYSRALPDARDGLKPVHRRILYQMGQMGLRPDRGHVKSARVVGEVMGRLHPHGESAIYDALVRMAQPFSMRLPFIDGHGNFGSPDDGPAAMRYTECRLAAAAGPMLDGIDEDVVDFGPNYDGREVQPDVLPAAVPALLVNGTTGIAVGMATSMAPHNLIEVIAAARHLLKHPDASLDALMRFVPGPDLPTGGQIIGLDGIREAYETGRGSFKIRATAQVESLSPRKRGIVVTELPFNVGAERVIEKIKELHNAKKITGISAVTDLSDGEQGTRLVIEVKSGFNPDAVLADLYRLTPLEDNFTINAVALVGGAPRTLGLRELLQVFLDHRVEVIRRRSAFRLSKAQERLHLVDGLLIAILDIDEVIQVIRGSDDTAMARQRLMEIFDLSLEQTNYILEMPLRRLTKFSRIELEAERDDLRATIAGLEELLGSDDVLKQTLDGELADVAEAFGNPRRTVLLDSAGPATSSQSLEIPDEPCQVLVSVTGMAARSASVDPPREGTRRVAHDALLTILPATTRGTVAVITSTGLVVPLEVVDLPSLPETADSPSLKATVTLRDFLHLPADSEVAGVAAFGSTVMLVSALGRAKRCVVEPGSKQVMALDPKDSLVAAFGCEASEDLVIVSSAGQLLRTAVESVPVQGAGARGVAGMRLKSGIRVVAAGPGESGDLVVTQAGNGAAVSSLKVTSLDAFPRTGRDGVGVRCHRLLAAETALLGACVARTPLACSPGGKPLPLPEVDERRDASGTPSPAARILVGRAAPPPNVVEGVLFT
ncbi:MAG TPA: DNA topoisomerase IV subunit A [Actinomycetota bacterium]|nr:DNA topoisomerase IV subunit A [Actinomycetota bacterium]